MFESHFYYVSFNWYVGKKYLIFENLFQAEALNSKNMNTESAQTPVVVDAQVQTKNSCKNNSCQTVRDVEKGKIDSQLQVNLQPDKSTIGTQTIKQEIQEIAMPNRPSSNAPKQSKTRKISSIQISPQNTSEGDATSSVPMTSTADKELITANDFASENDIYKLYCRLKNPNEAKKQIKQMKNLRAFSEPLEKMPKEENLQLAFKSFFETVWSECSPNMNQIVRFVSNPTTDYLNKMEQIKIPLNDDANEVISISTLLTKSYTNILLVQPKGFEWWFIKDYEKGPEISKWYRGYSCKFRAACRIALLNVMSVRIPATVDNCKKISWFDFAEDLFILELPGTVYYVSRISSTNLVPL